MNRRDSNCCTCDEFAPLLTKWRFRGNFRTRAQQLVQGEIGYIHDPSFSRLSYDDVRNVPDGQPLFAERDSGIPASGRNRLPIYLQKLYEERLLSPAGERHLFRLMNYLKYRANAVRSALNPDNPDRACVRLAEALLAEAGAIRDQIVSSNLRLVVSISRRYANDRTQFDDLVSEGNMILLNAVEKFDFSRGFRFSTYTTHAVQRHFYRQIKVRHRKATREATLGDSLMADAIPMPEGEDRRHRLAAQVNRLTSRWDECLNDRERQILEARYGLNRSEKEWTLRELSREMGVSKERIRQIQIRAEEKLQEFARREHLVPELDEFSV
ncbi:sigma-70 family RNA polymerase sigma factor [Maioricimonas rarisocia]|nr:sigma-70 family RNA polymerase sigma factor [Maioricimonas rarisocia]